MSNLETTELKLKTTPTGGLEAHASPYYRRLVSAGYKGFLQGTIGGASLYGALGAVVGGLATIPFAIATGGFGLGVLALIPAGAALGIAKGASTFGQIGSVAAINAESADLSEQRRYLLDRYYDLPEGPEGDREAATIREELAARSKDANKPEHMFHWKTVAVCALIGAALTATAIAIAVPALFTAPTAAVGTTVVTSISQALGGVSISTGLANTIASLGAIGLLAVGTSIGALTGATVGLDRYYIRKWFDKTQDVIHSGSHDYGLLERHQQVQRLKEAAVEDTKTKQNMDVTAQMRQEHSPEAIANAAIKKASERARQPQPAVKESEPKGSATKPVASLNQAQSTVETTNSRYDGKAMEAIARAMEVPVV